MIICALDYKKTANPLTCTYDGDNMQELARACGITDIKVMYDEVCTKENVSAAIAEMGSRCGPDDYFIFYYSGHGTNIQDLSGEEEDGMDEAFCFVDEAGQISMDSCMIDDDFAQVVTDNVPEEARIVILTDCCHSGSIADLGRACWNRREVISITGCQDDQTSGDIGTGGIFTHSMLMAIESLCSETSEYSAGTLYNATLHYDDDVFNSAQKITMDHVRSCPPDHFAWPLIPQIAYTSPMSSQGTSRDIGGGKVAPGVLQSVVGAFQPCSIDNFE